MGNLFADLPLPALNGPGAAVNTSGMGSPKTLEVAGSFQGAGITVEASVDGGTTWGPVTTFTNVGGQRVVQLAAELMRVRVSGRKASVPFTANCDVGAPDAGSLFALIPMPVLNGPGASVNVSSFGTQCTFIAGGDFPGASIRVEISEDGVAWATLLAFAGKGDLRSTVVTAAFVRANVSGRNPLVAFSGTLAMGAANDGAAAVGIAVSDDGTSIGAGPFTELDFIGGGVVAADAGGGVASITIAGGGGSAAVIFDDAIPANKVNIRSDRASNQSPINNAVSQITNLGSDDGLILPAATGATAMGATIGGGNDNQASNTYATVAGGAGNIASGDYATASGRLNTASGSRSVAMGVSNLASSTGCVAMGQSNTATATQCVAMGLSCDATASQAHAVGNNCNATASQAVAMGNNCDAIGSQAVSIGNNCDANGFQSTAIGNNCLASGDQSVAMGDFCVASGQGSVAMGDSSIASGTRATCFGDDCDALGVSSFAIGSSTTATGDNSAAFGRASNALRGSQVALAGASVTVDGSSQTSFMHVQGDTPGAGAGETVDLFDSYGNATIVLEDGRTYAFKITAACGGFIAAVRRSRTIELTFNARRDAGVTVITAVGPGASYGDAATAAWALAALVGAGPDRIIIRFSTGATTAATRVSARMEFTETVYP